MRNISYKKFELVGKTNRRLSVKECKVIQTFPEKYYLDGSLWAQYHQIGNAVPPLLAEHLAKSVKKCLLGINLDYCDHWCSKEKQDVKQIQFRDSQGVKCQIKLCEGCYKDEFIWD